VSTTTLERKAKTEVVEPPEPIHPCRPALVKLLSEHNAITAGIEEFESRLGRAELDLNHAIENDSDEDIDRFQSQVSVYGVKLSAKRATLNNLLASLPTSISSTANEFGTLVFN
jgi:hypothetical protein